MEHITAPSKFSVRDTESTYTSRLFQPGEASSVESTTLVVTALDQIQPSALFTDATDPQWLHSLRALETLNKGWDGHDADPPKPQAIDVASGFLSLAHSRSFPPTRIAPSVEGGVAFTYTQGDRTAVLEFYNDGTGCLLLSDEISPPQSYEVASDYRAFNDCIEDVGQFLGR